MNGLGGRGRPSSAVHWAWTKLHCIALNRTVGRVRWASGTTGGSWSVVPGTGTESLTARAVRCLHRTINVQYYHRYLSRYLPTVYIP